MNDDVDKKIKIPEKSFDSELAQLLKCNSTSKRINIVKSLKVHMTSKKTAFKHIADYLRRLELPITKAEVRLRVELLECLSLAKGKNAEAAVLVVDDLMEVASNYTLRPYYYAVFKYFKNVNRENSSELERLLDRRKCSRKLRRTVLEVLEECKDKTKVPPKT